MDIVTLQAPLYTGLFTAALMIMQMVLMGMVIKQRVTSNVLIGDGDEALLKTIRVHGNFVENAPIFLVGLALIEVLVASNTWVLVMGSVFLLGRVLHAVGMSITTGPSILRAAGALASLLVTVVAACYLGYAILQSM